MVRAGTEQARKELEAECTWLQKQRGHAKIAFKEGDDPSFIWHLDDLIISIQARIADLGA